MTLFWSDFFSTLGCVGLFLLMLLGAGSFLARELKFPGFDDARGFERAGVALLCALACLPVMLDLAGRFGAVAMASLAGVIACAGLPALLRGVGKPDRRAAAWLAVAFAGVVVSIVLLIDWPMAGGLKHSLLVIDYVKHAESTWAIAQSGTPPLNPAFYEPEHRAAYYYFFYTLTACVELVAHHAFGAQARHAAYASASIAAFALLALMSELWKRSGADEAVHSRSSLKSPTVWMIGLLLAAGLDLIPWTRMALGGQAPTTPETWADQITTWVSTALWTPHHAAALIAAFVGFIALARPAAPDPRRILLAGLAFASAAGLSVYIAMGAAATAALWLAALLANRRLRDAAALLAAGALAAVFAAPWLATVVGRATGEAPIAFAMRNAHMLPYQFANPALDALAHLTVMALVYVIQFGIFALGGVAFWRAAGRNGLKTDIGLILVLSTAASFIIGSFLRSTMINNDLGWRIMLFAQTALLIWTLAAIRAGLLFDRKSLVSAASICLMIGYADLPLSFYLIRTAFPDNAMTRVLNLEERRAFSWLDANLAAGARMQAQPRQDFSFNFGLYGRFPAAVADCHEARLFGAANHDVSARIAELTPIFSSETTTIAEAETLAARYQLAGFVVTADDPVFDKPNAWVTQKSPAFASPHVRVYLFDAAARLPVNGLALESRAPGVALARIAP